jgi:hypothetical protein
MPFHGMRHTFLHILITTSNNDSQHDPHISYPRIYNDFFSVSIPSTSHPHMTLFLHSS